MKNKMTFREKLFKKFLKPILLYVDTVEAEIRDDMELADVLESSDNELENDSSKDIYFNIENYLEPSLRDAKLHFNNLCDILKFKDVMTDEQREYIDKLSKTMVESKDIVLKK